MRASKATFAGEFEPGDWVADRYRVESTLGHGGMGAVYRVRDERRAREVALKQLHPPREEEAVLLEHFEREYHTLCQLAHPSIIEVYDYGVRDGSAYYTMELLEGQDLRERGTLPWRDACPLLRDVASSLAILHSRKLVHRDISARNVRCTGSGRAKLIDFGAMSAMGVVRHVVGTPPFLPPEALRLQVLDGRSDLYALGSLAYWTLTGRYAYPARSVEQLPELWRTPPPSPRQYHPDIPEPLDRLVMELLELEPAARPSTAAEVMERLCGVAGLELTELPAVSRAYLVTPMLVGRELMRQELRQKLQLAIQGRGGCSLLIQGDEGTGRTRMLAAAVLEAKLLGATVLRADASDRAAGSAAGEYGVAKALCRQLLDALPVVARTVARPWFETLAELLPELKIAPAAPIHAGAPLRIASGPPSRAPSLPRYSMLPSGPVISEPPAPEQSGKLAPERRVLQSALRDWLLTIARRKALVIAVDDFDAIDEPSAALIGMLCHRAARRRLGLVLALEPGDLGGAALALVREVAQPLSLSPLTPHETDVLLRSVFGDVDHVTGLSERVHQLANGNPRWTMALAERLVERGVARYEAGSWRLPSEIGRDDLPASLGAALAARIQALSSDARELAEVLALTEPELLCIQDYARLVGYAQTDPARLHRALDALSLAAVLVPAGDRFRFGSDALRAQLQAGIEAARALALHARIALVVERSGDIALHAHHLLLAGQEAAAVERLRDSQELPLSRDTELRDQVLEQAAAAAERLGYPQATQLQLQSRLALLAAERGHYARFTRFAAALLRRFEQDSGLLDCANGDASRSPAERWSAAQRSAARRRESMPPTARGLSPRESTELLVRMCGASVAMAAISQRLELVACLPELEPIALLSPDARVTVAVVEIQKHLQAGRFDRARIASLQLLEEIERPDAAKLSLDYKNRVRWGQLYMQGLFAAVIGARTAREWVAELEREPGYRANAWRVRMVYELMHGNQEAANACRHRAELLNLQDSGQLVFPGTTARIELQAHIYGDDVIGLKRTVERIEGLAAQYPGWQPTLDLARSHYRRLQGDYEGALLALQPALHSALPNLHFDWGLVQLTQVALLSALGRHEQAVEFGQHGLQVAREQQLVSGEHGLMRVVAEALARAGRPDEGEPLADAHIARHERWGARGIQLGLAYEARARVAIAKGDEAALRHYAQLCAQEYRGGRSVTLNAKYKSLMREADAAGIAVTTSLLGVEARDPARMTQRPMVTGLLHTASSRLLGCVNQEERVQEALRLLLEATGAEGGYLFRAHDNRLEFLAGTDRGGLPPPELVELLAKRLHRESEPDAEQATTFQSAAMVAALQAFTDDFGRDFEPLVLFDKREGKPQITALAALHYPMGDRTVMLREVLDVLAVALSDQATPAAPEEVEG